MDINERKPVNYWKEKEEILMKNLRQAMIDKDEVKINYFYHKIRNKLRFMIESILVRYYSGQYNYHDTDIIVNDTETHCLMSLKKFDEKNKTRFYSYVGTIAKRFIYSRVVMKFTGEYMTFKRGDSLINWDNNDDIIENLDNINFLSTQPQKEFDIVETNEARDILFKYLDNLKKEYQTIYDVHYKNNDKIKLKRVETSLICVEAMRDTINYFGKQNIGAEKSDMVNYITEKYNVSVNKLNVALKTKNLSGTRLFKKTENKYINEIIDFDFSPNHNLYTQNKKMDKIKEVYNNNNKLYEK